MRGVVVGGASTPADYQPGFVCSGRLRGVFDPDTSALERSQTHLRPPMLAPPPNTREDGGGGARVLNVHQLSLFQTTSLLVRCCDLWTSSSYQEVIDGQ